MCQHDKESVLRCPDNSKLLNYGSETINDELQNKLPTTFDCLKAIVGKDVSRNDFKSKKTITVILKITYLRLDS